MTNVEVLRQIKQRPDHLDRKLEYLAHILSYTERYDLLQQIFLGKINTVAVKDLEYKIHPGWPTLENGRACHQPKYLELPPKKIRIVVLMANIRNEETP